MVTKLVPYALTLLCMPLSFACSDEVEPRTELLLVADTDIAGATSIAFQIEYKDERKETRTSPFSSPDELPRTLAFVRDEAPLGPFTVSASIEVEGQTVSRSHTVSFVPGQTLVVPLHLSQACIRMRCTEQCSENGCVPTALEASALEPHPSGTGRPLSGPPMSGDPDASMSEPDAAMSIQDLRTCNGAEVDVLSHESHCGRCNNACSTQPPGRNALGTQCEAGACKIVCQEGFADCNGRRTDGCEEALATSGNHCGACGVRCNNGSSCVQSACTNRGP